MLNLTLPGPVIVDVAQGELVYVNASDCVHRTYPAGTAFIDPGRGSVHTAYNRTGGETILIATLFEGVGGPLTITDGVTPGDCASCRAHPTPTSHGESRAPCVRREY